MNRFHSQKSKAAGSVLLVTLLTTAIIGGVLTGYMVMVSSNQKATVRSEAWNRALPLGEAGVEEAMAHLNKNFLTNMLIGGWALDGTNWSTRRNLSDGYYAVSIGIGTNPVIYATGGAAMPLDSIYLERTIRVQTVLTSVIQNAIAVKKDIKFNGYNVSVDSYDSLNPLYSGLGGRYIPSRARDRGDIASNLGVEGAFDLGNARVAGRVHTGANGTVTPGPNASVGDEDWVQHRTPGIQDGHALDDSNAPFIEVEAPFTSGMTAVGGRVGVTAYNYILDSGNYVIADFRGQVLVRGNAVVLVTDRCQFSGLNYIRILPGASLQLYVACASANIGGLGVINESGLTTAFQYMGLPSNTSVSIAGNGEFSGLIYAPNAAVALNGGGNFYGAIAAASLSVTGNFHFHFDEALNRVIALFYFAVTSWDEI